MDTYNQAIILEILNTKEAQEFRDSFISGDEVRLYRAVDNLAKVLVEHNITHHFAALGAKIFFKTKANHKNYAKDHAEFLVYKKAEEILVDKLNLKLQEEGLESVSIKYTKKAFELKSKARGKYAKIIKDPEFGKYIIEKSGDPNDSNYTLSDNELPQLTIKNMGLYIKRIKHMLKIDNEKEMIYDSKYPFVKPGAKVWWEDPEGISSGYYKVISINGDGTPWSEDTIVLIADECSEAEVTLDELRESVIFDDKQ